MKNSIKFSLTFILLLNLTYCYSQSISSCSTSKKDVVYPSLIEQERFPIFPSDINGLYKFLDENLNTEIVGDSSLKKGKVLISFDIDTFGVILNPIIVKSYSKLIDEEFLRVIKIMPNWVPGQLYRNNTWIKTEVKYALPLHIPYNKTLKK